MYDVDELYPNTRDLEQLYDLEADPNQKENIFNNGARMMANSEVISEFETIMREYIDLHCIATNGAQCVKPDLRFGQSGGGYFLDLPTTTQTVIGDPITRGPTTTHGDVTTTLGGPSQCAIDNDCNHNEV